MPNDLAIFTPDTDFFTDFRKAFPQFHIGFVLIGEAANETAALTGDFCGIERESLLFGHLDGYGVEFLNKSGTTDFTAASAEAVKSVVPLLLKNSTPYPSRWPNNRDSLSIQQKSDRKSVV